MHRHSWAKELDIFSSETKKPCVKLLNLETPQSSKEDIWESRKLWSLADLKRRTVNVKKRELKTLREFRLERKNVQQSSKTMMNLPSLEISKSTHMPTATTMRVTKEKEMQKKSQYLKRVADRAHSQVINPRVRCLYQELAKIQRPSRKKKIWLRRLKISQNKSWRFKHDRKVPLINKTMVKSISLLSLLSTKRSKLQSRNRRLVAMVNLKLKTTRTKRHSLINLKWRSSLEKRLRRQGS